MKSIVPGNLNEFRLLLLRGKAIKFTLFFLFVVISSCKKEEEPIAPKYTADFNFSFDNSSNFAPATVIFTNNSTGAVSYSWNFDDGTFSSVEDPIHTYNQAGEYEVTLIAQFPDGGSLTKSKIIEVILPAAPVASFTANPDTCSVNTPVYFSNNSTNAVSYQWSFGDGQGSNQQNPVHSYVSPGIYTVSLIASNSIGQTDMFTRQLVVTIVPFPNLTQISIGQLLSQYQGSTIQIGTGSKIVGTVVSDRTNGNISSSKNMIVWDGSNGILVRFQNTHTFNLGTNVEIDLQSCLLKNYFGNIQLDSVPLGNSLPNGNGNTSPVTVSISQIQQNPSLYTSALVRLNNVNINGGSGIYSGTVSVTDGTTSIGLYTYPSASFVNQVYPTSQVNITALVQIFNGQPQLTIRNTNDVQ